MKIFKQISALIFCMYALLSTNSALAQTWTFVAAGGNSSYAIKSDGSLWAWGRNEMGQLGIGNTTRQFRPVQVGTATDWVYVAANKYYATAVHAIKSNGTLWAWGRNESGQLGIGNTTDQNIPVQVGTATNWKSVFGTIGVKTDGTIWKWGGGTSSPVQVGTDTDWKWAAEFGGTFLAVKTNGTLWGWGGNYLGQLGLGFRGTEGAPTVPTQIGTATNWDFVMPGYGTSHGVRTDGTMWAWGLDELGALGTGAAHGTYQLTPIQMGTATNWSKAQTGYQHKMGIRTDGTIWTWGSNYGTGQLGVGTTETARSTPSQIGGAEWVGLDGGTTHTIALKSNGEIWLWGNNDDGQMGTGAISGNWSVTSPIRLNVPSISIAITAGSQSVCTGASVTFTATVANTSATAVYQWKKNGTVVGSNSATYTTSGLANGDIITCTLTSEGGSPVSNGITMSVSSTPPSVPAITGASAVDIGASISLTNATAGGTWTSSNTSLATVDANGLVTGLSSGDVTITYTLTNACGANTATKVVHINDNSSYCLKFVPHRVGNTVEMTVRMIGSGSQFRLGDANLQIKYNSAALGSPTLVSEAFTANGHYSGISVTEPAVLDLAPNEAVTSINSSFTGTTGQGLAISNDPEGTLIAVIRFQILDAAIAPNLQSYINDDIGSILFNDNTTNPALVPSTGGCTGYNIALATVLTYSQTGYCVSVTSQAANLVGTTGGTFSSTTGLTLDPTTGAINPSTSTVGTYWVTYTIPSSQGGTTATQVTINPLPTPAITSLNALYCHGVAPFALTGTPVGGTFTIDGNPATNFDASTLSIGTHNVIYSYSDANACSATASQNVEVNAAPVVPAITGESYVFLGYTITLSNTAVGGTWSSSNTANATIDAAGVVTGVALGNTTVSYAVTNVCGTTTATKAIEVRNNSVELALKALLHGNYNTTTGLMSDDLRTGNLIPSTEPYTGVSTYTHRGTGGGETVASNVLTVSGNNAIVDWMFIELRDKNAPRTILYTRAALIQRDGDIVDVDGVSPVVFTSVIPDNYYIAIRHRNHLGFRTASAVAVGRTAATTLDLSNNSVALFGRNPLKLASNGKYMMHGGNGDNNAAINSIDKNIIWLPQNGTTGYKRPDFNLDGVVNAFDINGVWLYSNSVIQQLDF